MAKDREPLFMLSKGVNPQWDITHWASLHNLGAHDLSTPDHCESTSTQGPYPALHLDRLAGRLAGREQGMKLPAPPLPALQGRDQEWGHLGPVRTQGPPQAPGAQVT